MHEWEVNVEDEDMGATVWPALPEMDSYHLPDNWKFPDVKMGLGSLTLVTGSDESAKAAALLNLAYGAFLLDSSFLLASRLKEFALFWYGRKKVAKVRYFHIF